MKKKVTGRLILIAALILASLGALLPNTSLYSSMPDWWKQVAPDRGITLGLDLQGGLHLVFEVQGDKAVSGTLDRTASAIRKEAMDLKEATLVTIEDDAIKIAPLSTKLTDLIARQYPELQAAGDGKYKFSSDEVQRIKAYAVDQALETIRNRIDQFGVSEPTIIRQGSNEIVVQLPGVKDPKRAIDLIGKTAMLEFKIVDDKASIAAQLPQAVEPGKEQEVIAQFASQIPEGDEILFTPIQKDPVTKKVLMLAPMLLKKEALITGDLLSDARVSIDTRYNEPYVSLTFNAAGAQRFAEVTERHVRDRMAIVLDSVVHSAPVIREKIAGGSAQISGSFTMDESKDLAIVLKAGALPAPMEMLQNVTVGPSLGRDSIEAGKMAGIVAAALVIGFMLIYYRLSGLIADVAMVMNILLLLGAMAALKATMTLPGIAGVILAIGMAVDSNVLMFERMREELRAGKTPRAAVDSGYDKAFWTIFDSHVTTLITSLVLFQFGTGPIKGFAVTLSLGVAINLFTALIGTKTIFDLLYHQDREVKNLSI